NDEPGRLLLRSFRHKRIPVTGILRDKNYATVTKTRILAGMPHTGRQQVVRLDREPDADLAPHAKRELALAARQYLRASDALLVSDYGYGAASPEILNAARNKGAVLVVLDSRHRMLEFSGITAATPNEPEVEEALGRRIRDWDTLCSAGTQIMSRMNLQSLIITRGRDGMVSDCRFMRDMICVPADRKSTRLNSSHVATSCAGFCSKKETSISYSTARRSA